MSKLRLMKKGAGDECLATWDRTELASIAEARETFQRNFTPGRMAFRLDPMRPGFSEPITEFDIEAEEILLVPAVTGG
jgi:hypothetical protein